MQAQETITFTPTQEFVRNYFTPESAYKGLLLYHGVGTGKTCAAISIATTSFEPAGYTVLWVTRHTLRKNFYKNMFEEVCHVGLRDRIQKGELTLPDDASQKPASYLSDRWLQPLSFLQMSNLCAGKNDWYRTLAERNGAEDPLRKTLIIIDEAHRLFANMDMDISERPDTAAIHTAIQRSYVVSGANSARVLLLTATPINTNPFDMVSLLNILRTPMDQLPAEYETFAARFLNSEASDFTESGRREFIDKISGYVSYLNRANDVREFAYPVSEYVDVPFTESARPQLEAAMHVVAAQAAKYEEYLQNNIAAEKIVRRKMRDTMETMTRKCRRLRPELRNYCEDQYRAAIAAYEDDLQNRIDRQKQANSDYLEQANTKIQQLRENLKNPRDDLSQEMALERRCGIQSRGATRGASQGPNQYNNRMNNK